MIKPDWIRIEDRSTWVIDKFEKINPANEFKYVNYWKEIKRRCIEGMWAKDFDGYRYMTPNLYFYVNLCTLTDTDEKTKQRSVIRPQLSDLEWELSYMFFEAKGFSGWTEDKQYTSCHKYRDKCIENEWFKFEDIPRHEMLDKKGNYDDTIYKSIFVEDGSRLKEYIHPRENIRMLHGKPMGLPLYYNNASNTIVLGSRGGGKSYYTALAECLHYLIFDGVKYYTKDSIDNPPKAEICIGSADTDKSSEFFDKMVDCLQEFATNEDLGVWGQPSDDDYMPNPFYKDMSGSSKAGNKKNPFIHKYKKKIKNRWVDGFGTHSKAAHVSYAANKQGGDEAGAGGRYPLSVIEECGLVGTLKQVHASNTYTVTLDGEQFGVQAFIGTSGNMELVQHTKEMFNDPESYNILAYDNVWENTDKKIGFFLPVDGVDRKLKDENGNTRWEEADKKYSKIVEKAKQSANPETYRKVRLFTPRVPSDMWVSNKGKILPADEAQARIKLLETNYQYKKLGLPVKLIWDLAQPTGVRYEHDYTAEPFYEISNISSRDSIDGCVMIYEPPNMVNGSVPSDMYKFIGHDPYVSDDQKEGSSLGATHVILNPKYRAEGYNGGKIVATFIGKPHGGKEKYYETQEKLIQLYGNPQMGLWYEANRGQACRDYYLRKGKTYLLCLRPQRTQGAAIHLKRVANYGWIVGNRVAKIQLLEMLRDWLLEPCKTMYDEITGATTILQRNIDQIDCLFTLKEIEAFDLDEGNYDAVMSLVGAVLGLREEEHLAEQLAVRRSEAKNHLSFLSTNSRMFNSSINREKKLLEKVKRLQEELPNPYRKNLNTY